jgi:hypothetical protein
VEIKVQGGIFGNLRKPEEKTWNSCFIHCKRTDTVSVTASRFYEAAQHRVDCFERQNTSALET